jgi:hypothetical protein
MSLREILVAIALVAVLAVLSSAGSGWDAGGVVDASEAYPTLAGSRQHLVFALGAGAVTVAALLAEHARRSRK